LQTITHQNIIHGIHFCMTLDSDKQTVFHIQYSANKFGNYYNQNKKQEKEMQWQFWQLP